MQCPNCGCKLAEDIEEEKELFSEQEGALEDMLSELPEGDMEIMIKKKKRDEEYV